MRIFTINVFKRISIQAHLVRVDLLDTRILQADALLMHSMAKKESVISFRKKFTFTTSRPNYMRRKNIKYKGRCVTVSLLCKSEN